MTVRTGISSLRSVLRFARAAANAGVLFLGKFQRSMVEFGHISAYRRGALEHRRMMLRSDQTH